MEKYINKTELAPALFRAIFTFFVIYLIFTNRIDLDFIGSRGIEALMLVMIVMMAYTLVTLFLPQKVSWPSVMALIVDGLILAGLMVRTGGARSAIAYMLPLVVIEGALKLGAAFAGGVAAVLGALIVFLNVTEFTGGTFRLLFWIFYFVSTYLACVIIFGERGVRKSEADFDHLERQNLELEQHTSDLEKKLSMYTIIDGGTGMKNFRYFRTRVEEEMKRANRLNYPFCVCVMGIDEKDEYCQQSGAQEWRKALIKVGQALELCVRDTDLIAKYVEDQFLILFPQASPRQAVIPAMRIAKRLKTLTFGPSNTFEFHYSMGISGYPDDARDIGGVFSLSSAALERSRQRGTGMITLASSLWRTQT